MSSPTIVPGDEDRTPPERMPVRPYGLFGLAVSFILILVAAIVATLLIAGSAFLVVAIVLGWKGAFAWIAALPGAAGSETDFLQRAGVISSLFVYAALSGAVLAVARWRGRAAWRDLIGWRPWNPLRKARLFWVVVAATIAYGFAADAIVSNFYPASRDWVSLPAGALWTTLFIILAIVFAPITEELLFRGWLYTGLRLKIGTWAGILVTSLLFAIAHWEKTHLYALIVFPVGLMLGFLREKTASLKASMALHALFNSAASVALLFSK